MCKRGDTFSLAILIGRGLDLFFSQRSCVSCFIWFSMGLSIWPRIVGVIDAEGPPVPIPNTEVKLCRAEDTQLATARENRYMPTQTEVRPKA